jgi:membrane-bound metal-dependent hydrolase YbcI (DUF457 family)
LAWIPDSPHRGRILIVALTAWVLGLDLLWALSGAGEGSLLYGLIDEPAHLATCGIALILVLLLGRIPSRTFVLSALLASVAIDFDHLPQYLGVQAITVGTPRPYVHCGLAMILLCVGAILLPRWRALMFGVAFGFAAHLARDVVTGPGVPFALPFSESAFRVPYLLYGGTLVAVAGACLASMLSGNLRPARPGAEQ